MGGGGSDIIEFMKTIKRYISTTSRISLSTISYSITYILIGVVIFLTLTPIALAQSLPATDRDTDNDGLIEINSLAQLNALRHDGDGDGTSSENVYNTQLGSSLTNSGCPSTCKGYELTADLDFDTNGDGSVDGDDDYHNSGDGWLPIGDGTNTFNATFHGNGHTISNLTIDRSTSHWGGLFGELGEDAVVRNLGLIDASVSAKGANRGNPGEHGVGALAGVSRGLIYHTYSNGVVTGEGQQRNVGGLVGYNEGRILASYSQAKVTGDYKIGGLVGLNKGSILWTYATGNVRNSGFDGGGLVGDQSNDAEIKYSYSTGDVNQGFGTANAGGLISGSDDGTITQSYFDSDRSNRPSSDSYSKTSSQLQSPVSASDIFSDWDKSELTIYEGRLSLDYPDLYLSGYKKDEFGSLSPTAIGSATIEQLFHSDHKSEAVYIKITENDVKIDATDVLKIGDIMTLEGRLDQSTLKSPITNIEISSDSSADVIITNLSRSRLNTMFDDNTRMTVRFSETIVETKHGVDVSNLWDFGTSNDLPLLSVDFNGDGTASVSEFGEQVDETKPVITINGDDTTYVITGSAYTDKGATVIDPRNHRYTGVVTTTIRGPSGQTSFDNTVLGDWTFTYSAPADSAGNVPNPVARVVKVITRPTAETSIFHAKYKPGNWIIQSDNYHGHLLPDNNTLTDSDGVAHNTFTYNSVTYTFQQLSYIGDGSLFDLVIKEGSNNLDEETVFADVSLVFIDENDDVWVKPIKDYDSRLRLKSQQEYCCSPFVSVIPWKRWRGTDTTIYVYLIDTAAPETDEIKPVITLTGSASVSITSGSSYTDAGATVADPGNPSYSGTVSTAIRGPSGQTSFDSAVVGDWTFTYTAPADSSGNVPDAVIRTVTITASTPTPNPTPNQPAAIFSANFTPGNVVSPPNEDGISGHQLPSHNALTNDNGVAHNTFTLGGVTYTVNNFSYESSGNVYFEVKAGSNHVDEQTVFADYSLVIVNENDEIFTKEIAEFEYSTNSLNNWAVLDIPKLRGGSNPFEYTATWESWYNDNTITVGLSIVETSSLDSSSDTDGGGSNTPAIFSANFAPRTLIHSGDYIYGHRLPSKNALTDDDGNSHNTFTLGGVEYTVDEFSQNTANEIYFRIKEGSNHVDERAVFADYSLVVVNGDGETFTKEITDFFGNIRGAVRLGLSHSSTPPPDPFENPNTWNAIRKFSIVETSRIGASLDFDGNGTFTPSQDALALYLVTQLSTNANTLSSYVHDGATETASTTITLVNSLTIRHLTRF